MKIPDSNSPMALAKEKAKNFCTTKVCTLSFILLFTLIPGLVALPLSLNYRGKIYDNAGAVNSAKNIRFQLFTVPSAGTALFDTGYQTVQISGGYFTYTLTPVVASWFTNAALYLDVDVQGSGSLVPRERLTSAGFSLNADTVNGMNPGFSGANYVVRSSTNKFVGIGTNLPRARLHVNGKLRVETNAVTVRGTDMSFLPRGAIMMWAGTLATIPAGWALCDGANGTPDLRDRFIMCVDTAENPGAKGGTNTIALTAGQLPSHQHTGTTSDDGLHSGHPQWNGGGTAADNDSACGDNGGPSTPGDHQHSFTTLSAGLGQTIDKRPAFYRLAMIMKL